MVENNNVSILVLYYQLIEYGIYEIYIQHSLLYFLKEYSDII